MSPWATKVYHVVEKELRAEYRTKYALNAMLLFCVTCLAVVSFAVGGSVSDTRVQAALLWIMLFFSAMSGLSRSFVKEEEMGTIRLLRLTSDPTAVFFGKALFNLLLLLVVLVVLSVFFPVFLNVTVKNWGLYILSASLASVTVSVLCTLISAIVAGTRVRGTLFPILSFPVLLPVFIVAVQTTRLAIEGAPIGAHTNLLFFLGAFGGAAAVACVLLFEFLFYE